MKPIQDEIAFRQRQLEESKNERLLLAAPERRKATAEEVARISAAAGFTVKRFDALRKKPMASTTEELEQAMAPSGSHWTEKATPEELAELRAARAANSIVVELRLRAANQVSKAVFSELDNVPPPIDGESLGDLPPDWMDEPGMSAHG